MFGVDLYTASELIIYANGHLDKLKPEDVRHELIHTDQMRNSFVLDMILTKLYDDYILNTSPTENRYEGQAHTLENSDVAPIHRIDDLYSVTSSISYRVLPTKPAPSVGSSGGSRR